jgi:hypothetical protein
MALRIVWLLGLVFTAATATAQPSDTLKLDSLPPPAFATRPRTEAEFLARYGTSDSNRALIKWWFQRRRSNTIVVVLSGVSIIAGGATLGQLFTRTTVDEALTVGPFAVILVLGGGIGTVGSLASRPAISRNRLAKVLQSPQGISPSKWQRALEHRRRVGMPGD